MKQFFVLQLGIAIPLALGAVTINPLGNYYLAQLTPDDNLGTESSIVTPQQLRDLIQGGAIRGNALFHSFDEFNVNEKVHVAGRTLPPLSYTLYCNT